MIISCFDFVSILPWGSARVREIYSSATEGNWPIDMVVHRSQLESRGDIWLTGPDQIIIQYHTSWRFYNGGSASLRPAL